LTLADFFHFLVATPTVQRDRLNLRAWFVVFCVYLAAVALASHWGLTRYVETEAEWARTLWLLGLYVFYFSLACTFVPIPTTWFVLFLASPVGGLPLGGLERVLVVGGLGALATGMAHLNEYHVIAFFFRLRWLHRVKETRLYAWAERLFLTAPFSIQFAFNIIPIPADPARWLAILYGYPLPKFFLAHALGRFVRYGLLAATASLLRLGVVEILVIQAALVVLAAGRTGLSWRRRRRARAAAPPTEGDTA